MVIAHLTEGVNMQQEKVHGKPARRRPKHPHIAPRGLDHRYITTYTALEKPFVGLSDGRIYDPRSRCALDWWGTGMPVIEAAESELVIADTWQVLFPDEGLVVFTRHGIYVATEPKVGQLRIEDAPSVNSVSRRLRREKQCGRRPVREGCPLLMSTRPQPQEWPPPEPVQIGGVRDRASRAPQGACSISRRFYLLFLRGS